MINTKNKSMTPAQRKIKVANLREEHQKYFDSNSITDAIYIPKMAYRPPGKDELHVSFFPSEFEKEQDIYTEFVSIEYDTEDPKRTLYLLHKNLHWKEEYELITSNSGFERHIVPVSELNVIGDVNTRRNKDWEELKTTKDIKIDELRGDFANLPDPEKTGSDFDIDNRNLYVIALDRIANSLDKIAETLTQINNK